MLCKIDENVPIDAIDMLSRAGHDCKTVYDEDLGGAPDERIAEVCRTEQRVLITLDLDFADIRRYPPGSYPGIVVLRPRKPDCIQTMNLLGRAITLLASVPVVGRLWIVEPDRVRVRGGESDD